MSETAPLTVSPELLEFLRANEAKGDGDTIVSALLREIDGQRRHLEALNDMIDRERVEVSILKPVVDAVAALDAENYDYSAKEAGLLEIAFAEYSSKRRALGQG